MTRCAFALIVAVLLSAADKPDEKKRIADLNFEVAKLRTQLAKSETELAKLLLAGKKQVHFDPEDFEIDQIGTFQTIPVQIEKSDKKHKPIISYLKVIEVVSDDELIVYQLPFRSIEFFVKGRSTRGITDGKLITIPGVWKISDTRTRGASTRFVFTPIESK